MDENFSYAEVQIMLEAIEEWVGEQETLYNTLLPSDPFRDELSHFLYTAQMLQKKLRKLSRSLKNVK